jgi:transcriptional regulator with XRE-family HTH domain
MTFAEKLRQLRENKGFTQASLAAQCGLSLGVVRDYEQGKRKPMLDSAFKLCRALAVPVEAFAECDGNDGPSPKRSRGRPSTPPADEWESVPKKRRGRKGAK